MAPTETKAHIDWLPHIDFELDAPVSKVWPHLLDWDTWMPDKVCKHVTGPEKAVGAVESIETLSEGEVISTIYGEIVRLEPERRIAYRLLPARETAGLANIDSARGHMIWNLYPLPGDRTLLAYETVAEMESSSLGQEEFTAQFAAAEVTGRNHWLEDYVPELKRLLAETT
ncbi:MAG TPA: hypothetical protein VFA66_01555 [Gaiellaceae bacterium]|nr:hypothetical protein [Gaiellaceae bacterium]